MEYVGIAAENSDEKLVSKAGEKAGENSDGTGGEKLVGQSEMHSHSGELERVRGSSYTLLHVFGMCLDANQLGWNILGMPEEVA